MDGTTLNTVSVDVALQGGGAHGAFTWGVLDRLLADETIDITAISGASAGAMNAAVAASGLAVGGREGARRSLTSFWEAVNRGARQLAPFIAIFDEFPKWTSATASWLNLLSGAQLSVTPHPSNRRPAQMLLEEIVRDHVDFDALRGPDAPRLFISATNARSGAARIFRNDDVTLDAIIASACLPLAFPSVEIEGEDYWDGGYSANPPLVQLVQESGNHDLILVTVNPISRNRTPSSPDKIPDRISELTFNQTLTKDIRAITMLKAELDGRPPICGVPFIQAVANLRLHEIQNEIAMREFDPKSKMFPSWSLLTDLHSLGSDTASEWLGANRGSLGRASTAKLDDRYL